MKQKHNFIEINGRRYDAGSGAPLDHAASAASASPTVSIPVHVVKPAAAAPAKAHHPNRQPARDVRSHAPQPARTLMRQAVRKPSPVSHERPLKVVGRLDLPASDTTVIIKPSISRLDAVRLHHAKQVQHSHLISRFDRRQLMAGPAFIAPETVATPIVAAAAQPAAKAPAHNKYARTTADVLEMAIQNATSHLQPPVKPERRHRVWHRRHAAAH